MVMTDNVGSYCIIDGNTKPAEELNLLNIDKMVYEVIRIIDGVPLFLEEHFKRLEKSLELIGIECSFKIKNITESLRKLAFVEQADHFNVKIIISVQESKQQMLVAYASKYYYPTSEEYSKGIFVSLFNIERDKPNVKKLNYSYTTAISEKIRETKAFELLLVNSNNQILEGSKSNVFFVQDKKVLTAPVNLVLEGITRRLVVEICSRMGIELIETSLNITDLSNIDAVFLTGTSIKVLPIASIDNYDYCSASNTIVSSIENEYNSIIKQYIQNYIEY